ncbi:S-layer homology domain-containing protein [Bacilliculturomica massiliensis]|uniref:S-layer homology domain-containing protein n=1 Tax=Bacilliculturomica massiliensis TaxID=1917867 RepID=UPI001031C1C0|nr:S-layer homology domain-containing protein [Bacilliculturomica massiliensis]
MQRRKTKKRKVCVLMAAALMCAAVSGGFPGGPEGVYGQTAVSSAKAQIGGKTAQLVYVDPAAVTADIALANDSVVSDTPAKSMLDAAAQASGAKVAAAINGAYFNAYYKAASGISYPNNCPRIYGTMLRDGKLINGGGTNQAATLGFTSGGKALIDWVSLSPRLTFSGPVVSIHWPQGQRSFEVTPWGLNNYYADASAVMQFTDEMTLPVTCPVTSKLVYVAGGKVTTITDGGTFSVPKGADVVVFNATAVTNAQQWDQFPAVGDQVDFAVKRTPAATADQGQWDQVVDAVSVGPMILKDGVSATGKDKVTDPKQAPAAVNQKSFAAVMGDGRLLLGTCTASFDQIASYLAGAGAVDAMSLDGGASSALYTAAGGFVKPAGRNLSNMVVFLEKPAETYIPFSNAAETADSFTDVKGHWAAGYIDKVMSAHLYSGTSKTTFGPDADMTRAMFVTALGKDAENRGRLSQAALSGNGAYAAQRFSDVTAGQWYTAYVGWAEQIGLVSGTGAASFSPNDPIEREQVCIILQKYLTYLNVGGSAEGTDPKAAGAEGNTAAAVFPDDGNVSGWARNAVYAMKAAGIVNGYEDGTFRPHGHVARGEAAVMLVKGLEL